MSDQATSLPIRSESDGTDQRVHVKIVDGTNPAVNQATVDSDKNLHVLAEGHDPTSAAHPVRTSELGAVTPDGVYDAANNTKPGNVGLITSTRSATPGDTTQTMRVTGIKGSTDTTVWAQDVSLHDATGNAYTVTNPLPVALQNSSGGVTVFDYKDATAIAAGSSDNHDYAVTTGKTLTLKQIVGSASGKAKMTVQSSPDGTTFTTLAVMFNSTANPNMILPMSEYKLVSGTGAKVRVIMTNEEGATALTQDLYSTIVGEEN
jgi:hypothetical protein